jgi:hypothetical protein
VWELICDRETPQELAGFTLKLTVNERAVIFAPPLTLTVAVCVPAGRFARGCTVKVRVDPAAILERDVVLRLKLLAFVPESATVSAPVA